MTAVPSDCNQPIVIRIPQVGYDPVKSVVAIGLGSNLNHPQRQLEDGLERLHQHPQVEILQVSPCFWTEPVVWPESVVQQEPPPPYLNGVALLATTLTPPRLMQAMLDVETTQGRTRERKWASRTLDLDILLWERQCIDCPASQHTDDCGAKSLLPEVVVPHPRLRDRPFVLVPLNSLVPDWLVPGEKSETSVRQLAGAAGTDGVDIARPTEIAWPHSLI